MFKTPCKLLKLTLILNLCGCAGIASANTGFPKTCEIAPDSIARIKLGSSLNQVKAIYPSAKLTRTFDGDGVALVSVKVGNQDLAILYAGESDPNEKINFSNKIEQIETFNPVCKTKFGIHPKLTLEKSAHLQGGVTRIRMSEIEGRQYVTFKKLSGSFNYKINYCGDFSNDSMRETTKYLPDCTILSISISR